MEDTYWSMTELYNSVAAEKYWRQWYRHEWRYNSKVDQDYKKANQVFIMAPHGGKIERGTTELALATAGFTDDFIPDPAASTKYDYFVFNGNNPTNKNKQLHVTSAYYDDPVALELVQNSVISLAFHGCTDKQALELEPNEELEEEYKACLIGGLDTVLNESLEKKLLEAGFTVQAGFTVEITVIDNLDGRNPDNIINKNKRRAGAQLELTSSFRNSLFTNNSLEKRRKTTTPDFWNFVNTVRNCIELYKENVMDWDVEFGQRP